MTSNLAPVVLFVYNRPLHTSKTIESLQKNFLAKDTELFIYSDGPRLEKDVHLVQKIRQYIKNIHGFKNITIIERENNWGLSQNIIQGVNDVLSSHGKIIVLEDDLITSPYFLKYMNNALNHFQDKKRIMSISGYNHPPSIMKFPANYNKQVYFNYRNSSWGWGTWKDRWEIVDWNIEDFNDFKKNKRLQKKFNRCGNDVTNMLISQMQGKIDSWAIRFTYAHFKQDALSVCPVHSYVNNIGHDGSGQHCGNTNRYINDLLEVSENIEFPKHIEVDERVMDEFRSIYKRGILERLMKIIERITCKIA